MRKCPQNALDTILGGFEQFDIIVDCFTTRVDQACGCESGKSTSPRGPGKDDQIQWARSCSYNSRICRVIV